MRVMEKKASKCRLPRASNSKVNPPTSQRHDGNTTGKEVTQGIVPSKKGLSWPVTSFCGFALLFSCVCAVVLFFCFTGIHNFLSLTGKVSTQFVGPFNNTPLNVTKWSTLVLANRVQNPIVDVHGKEKNTTYIYIYMVPPQKKHLRVVGGGQHTGKFCITNCTNPAKMHVFHVCSEHTTPETCILPAPNACVYRN